MNVPWSRVGSEIIALLPLPEHCAVEKFLTSYPDNALSYSTPSHVGETDGESLALTFDAGGYVPHKTHLDDTHLIPGEVVSVSYKVNGFEEYHLLGVIDFQTNIFTTATFIGCGLVDRVKVYNNPAQPELGYTYEYQPSEGGIGVQLSDEWIFDTRLRFAVEYRGEVYWLKSVDSSVYELDSRVTVIRGINESPLIPDQNLDQTCTTDTLSETNDRITQDYFYV
ncbi:MAG: hypothetical protein C0603_05620 [Denitrovibrio sp.]|nr:MAG: hypothetical protein C0603_05620 [Denitrovibrio sp.]